MLETRGYRVFTALNADEALDRFKQGGVDLVLSDLIMPQTDGNELVRQMKEIFPDVPTVIIVFAIRTFFHFVFVELEENGGAAAANREANSATK